MPNTTDLHIPSNKVSDVLRYIRTELADLYPAGELLMFGYMLFEAFLGWDQVRVMLNRDKTINQSDLLKFHWAVEDLKQYRPIQHICGYTEFCNLRIQVSPDVLIPRPETEEMVSMLAQLTSELHISSIGMKILDLCTGSGCIALAMNSLHCGSTAYGVDISEKALAVARANAEQLDLSAHFFQGDVLGEMPKLPVSKFHVIVSNPPYVMDHERAEMQPNVLNYEPHMALFVPDSDPLLFYRAIADYARQHLYKKGLLALEINEHLKDEMLDMLQSKGFRGQCYRDFRDKDRYIVAQIQ